MSRSVSFALYAACAAAVIVSLLRVWRWARALGFPALLTTSTVAGAILMLSSMLPGSLGRLDPVPVAATCLALCAATVRLTRTGRPDEDVERASPADADPADSPRFPVWHGVVLLVALVLAAPAWPFLCRLPAMLLSPGEALPWDTVSYHLPGFVEYLQKGTLWSLDGPYQTYFYGFELIGNFPGCFFRTHCGLLPAHAYAILFLLASMGAITGSLLRLIGRSGWLDALTAFALASGVWTQVMQDELLNVGKNDIFCAAGLLAALAFLLGTGPTRSDVRGAVPWRPALCLSAVALGLGIATKAPALGFLPVFCTAAFALRTRADAPHDARGPAVTALLYASVALVVGGFFLVRNLLAIGHLVDPRLASLTWPNSVLGNLLNPLLYAPCKKAFLASAALLVPLAAMPILRRSSDRRAIGAVLATHGVAAAVFVATPFVFRPGDASWQLRLGMPLFTMASMLAAICVVARLPRPAAGARRVGAPVSAPRILGITLFGVACLVPVYWQRNPPAGLRGYETVKGLAPTRIYDWIVQQPGPLRIYSAGLRPYGLYGPGWRNRVFYDVHALSLMPEKAGKARLLGILRVFGPDLLLISVDPHPYCTSMAKPLVEWMRSRPGAFTEVFGDEAVSGFRVAPGAAAVLEKDGPPDLTVRMGA